MNQDSKNKRSIKKVDYIAQREIRRMLTVSTFVIIGIIILETVVIYFVSQRASP